MTVIRLQLLPIHLDSIRHRLHDGVIGPLDKLLVTLAEHIVVPHIVLPIAGHGTRRRNVGVRIRARRLGGMVVVFAEDAEVVGLAALSAASGVGVGTVAVSVGVPAPVLLRLADEERGEEWERGDHVLCCVFVSPHGPLKEEKRTFL